MLSNVKLNFRFMYLVLGLILLSLLSQETFAHGMSEADKLAIIEGGNWRYMWIGATHMLSGYDHLAFVFGIVFFLKGFKDIVKYVTAFTLGHSVTLIFATFNAIQLNYFAIDAIIALSVCYIAFSNLDGFRKYLNINPPNMLIMIVGLGLIHGFGLSTRLQELSLGPDGLTLANIISFNVGIEIGQISALVLMLVIIAAWRKRHSFQAFSLIVNYGLILMGGFLFLMQMHGYTHTTNPNEFIADKKSIKKNSDSKEITVTKKSDVINWTDTINITIPASGEKEYKLYLKKGSTFRYTWKTSGTPLFFDFHGEPEGDKTGYFKSFKKTTASHSSGSLTAIFNGTHGWYWKNKTKSPVVITLKVKGAYRRVDVK